MLKKTISCCLLIVLVTIALIPSALGAGSATYTSIAATKVTISGATITGKYEWSGTKPSRAGCFVGETLQTMKRSGSHLSLPSATTGTVSYNLKSLKPGTKYYYKFFITVNGRNYWSAVKTFTTAKTSAVSGAITATSAKSITETTAVLKGAYKWSGMVPTRVGCFLGTSASSLSSIGKVTDFSANSGTKSIKAKNLLPGTKYYYKFYITVNGKNYWSAVSTFKTSSTTHYRALLIGEVNYTAPLRAPDDDVMALKAVLTKGEEKYSVTTKIDAGYADVVNGINQLAATATKNDVTLFYYSGHGLQSSYDSQRGALCLCDGSYITGAELASRLSKIPGRVIVLLDSCFSGNMIYARSSGAIISNQNAALIDAFAKYDQPVVTSNSDGLSAAEKSGELRTSKFYVITAAAYNQSAIEIYSTNSELGFGCFSRGLFESAGYFRGSSSYSWSSTIPGDRNGDRKISINEAFLYAKTAANSYLASFNETQDVQVYPANSTLPMFFR